MGFIRTTCLRLALPALTSVGYAQQQPSIAGLTMGMSLSAAKAKLADFSITPLHVSGYLPDLQAIAAVKDSEGYIIAAMDDKVSYIYRQVDLPPEKAVDQKAYFNQVLAKYGQPTRNNDTWNWNGAGQLASGRDFDSYQCPIQGRTISVGPIPPFQPADRGWWWPHPPTAYFGVPSRDVGGCHTQLNISLVRSHSTLPANAVDYMAFTMQDPSLYFPAVSREIAKAKADADAKQKAVQKNVGPPI